MRYRQTMKDLFTFSVDSAYDWIDRRVIPALKLFCVVAVVVIIGYQLWIM